MVLILLLFGVSFAAFEQYWVNVPLDHFDVQDNWTFNLRIWKDPQGHESSKDAVIFFFICGEYTCKPPNEMKRSFPEKISEANNGIFYVLEHRYYGKS